MLWIRYHGDTRMNTVIMPGGVDKQRSREDWGLEINFAEREQLDLTGRISIRKSPKGKTCGFIHSAHTVPGCTEINTHQLLHQMLKQHRRKWPANDSSDVRTAPSSAALWWVKPLRRNTRIKRPARYGFISSIYRKVRLGNSRAAQRLGVRTRGLHPAIPQAGTGTAAVPASHSDVMVPQEVSSPACSEQAAEEVTGRGQTFPWALHPPGCTARPSPEPSWEGESLHPLPREQEREWQQVWALGPSPAVRTCGNSTDIHPELRLQRRVLKEGTVS